MRISTIKYQVESLEYAIAYRNPKLFAESDGMAKVKIEKIHEDERGSIHKMLFEGKEFIILFTKKGYLRGGDYHQSTQHDIVLAGKMEVRYKTMEREQTRILGAGEMINFKPNVPHIFGAKENTLIVEWLEGKFEKSYYQPYRRMVKK